MNEITKITEILKSNRGALILLFADGKPYVDLGAVPKNVDFSKKTFKALLDSNVIKLDSVTAYFRSYVLNDWSKKTSFRLA